MQVQRVSDNATCSSFSTSKGSEEWFLTVRTRPGIGFMAALDELADEYDAASSRCGLSDATAVFSRLFVSDFINQQEALIQSGLAMRLQAGALSIVEQKPVDGGQFALFSYHIRSTSAVGPVKQVIRGPADFRNECLCAGENYTLLYTANYSHGRVFDAYDQTTALFGALSECIRNNAMDLLANTIRTWIFVHDIDNHYQGMVRSRREFFSAHGLTDKTRYLASTGIDGSGNSPKNLVTVDSLSIGGLEPGQIIRIEAPTHLSPTILYNVTFERGLRVRFGDRSHLYISGTASIDNRGEVVHVGDVENQTRRTIENLAALLASQQATLGHMAYVIAYVRDFHDWQRVQRVLAAELGENIPLVAVESKVCRPAWLVELEGVAVVPDTDTSGFKPFI
jgi:enamine deaminase RidA (YjgF/YER057c/UK114 family)